MASDHERFIALGTKALVEKARAGGIKAFVSLTFPEYEWSWHHVLTCHYLNKFIKGEIKRLMIFEPPRHGKSELTSRRLPALIHGLYPHDEILAVSYNSELASDMTVDVQRIMDTEVFRHIFPHAQITPEGKASKYKRTRNEHELHPWKVDGKVFPMLGSYRSAGVGGSFTGRGGNWVLIDDPVKNAADADSPSFRDGMEKFYTSTIRTRLEKDARILITMTRWRNDDLAGRLLKLAESNPDADQWTVVSLPAIKEDRSNPYDPREIGDPLWPGKFDRAAMLATQASVGSRDWASLYQQRPNVEGGNIIQSSWIRYYKVLPPRFDQVIQSWDFAVKDKTSSDYTVGQVWGRIGTDKYLLDEVRGRWSFPMACEEVIKLSQKWKDAHKKLIEAKANGPAVVQTLRQRITGLVEVEPRGDKVSRAYAVAPEYESGHVYYPLEEIAPWMPQHRDEVCNFPRDKNDDRVDAETQALDHLRKPVTFRAPIGGHGSGQVFT
jgi:predicted phage terminase large subunit-like protein